MRALIPPTWRTTIRRLRRPIRFGSLRRTSPISDHWGRDRGTPIDRWYIERYLARHTADISGRVLEVRDSGYVERFGHDLDRVDVLDIDPANQRATIVADLAAPGSPPEAAFDAIVFTQVLQYVADVPVAIANLARALAPRGVLLMTVPAIGRIGRSDVGADLWRFTPAGIGQLLVDAFGAEVSVEAEGNVLAAVAFLAGAAAEELTESELVSRDECFPVVVLARVVRS
jgi:SAM-dependent methyltransferase